MTPLEDLEDFFAARNVDFALGETFLSNDASASSAHSPVTDDERRWVLAVATKTDLEVGLRPASQGCV
jgi:hypothetical protein